MSFSLLRFASACLFSAAWVLAQNAPVPAKFQPIYDNLYGAISTFDNSVKAGWDGQLSPFQYSPQLLSANSTQYTTLLGSNYYEYRVATELQELQALGATAVTVHINFPILYPPFYSQNPSLYQQFMSFYQRLASDVRGRGMKLVVESTVGMPFPGNKGNAYRLYLQKLSWADYMTGRAQNALNVAQLIQPDYLSVITEPDTEAGAANQPNAGTVSGSTLLLQTILSALVNDGVPKVVVGAGTGSWIADFPLYIQNFTATSISYYDIHNYPINNGQLQAMLAAADTIHAAGKQIAISECWSYKISAAEFGNLTTTQIYARDPFTFWIPIDISFFQALSDFANSKQLLFVSPFWSHYFSAYLDYSAEQFKTNSQILKDSYKAANAAVLAGNFTATGLAWEQLAIAAPDTTPPAAPSAPFANAVYNATVELGWAPDADNVGVAAFRLYRDGTLLTTTSMNSYNDQGLSPGSTYTYTLAAFDAAGNVSGPSVPLVVVTTTTPPPTVPQNLHVVVSSPTSVTVGWEASKGGGSGGGVSGYDVWRGLSADALAHYATSTTNSFTDANVTASTTYYYAVDAFSRNGSTSMLSNTLAVTIPAQ